MLMLVGAAAVATLVVVLVAVAVALSSRSRVEVGGFKPHRPPAPQPAAASPEDLMRAGRKLDAIKRYRELTGVGLREAKEAVEAMLPGAPALPAKSVVLRQVSDADIEAQIRTGHLIDAIRLYREKTGVGLKEAKDAVEAWRDRIRAS